MFQVSIFLPFTETSSIMLNWHEYKAFPTISHDACHVYLCRLEKTFLVAGSFFNPISVYANLESGFGMSKANGKSLLVCELIGMMFITSSGAHFTPLSKVFGKS